MMGKQHTQANTAILPVIVLALIFYLGFGWEYLLSIPIGIYCATLPDIDESMPPKRWRLVKFIIQALLLFIGVASALAIVHWFNLIRVGNHSFNKHAIYAFIVLIGYFAIYAYSKTKGGKFLFAHRGFTHTLIPSILTFLCFNACRGFIGNSNMWINYGARIGCIILIGILIGITGHIFMDGLCSAGVPILWPITKKNIHWGFAKTSDPNAKDKTHISSKIYTYVVMAIIYTIGVIMILVKFGVLQLGR